MSMDLIPTAVYEEVTESEGGGFVAYAEEFPGAISEGDTLEEARENLRDAVGELLEANRQMTAISRIGKKVTRETIAVPLSHTL